MECIGHTCSQMCHARECILKRSYSLNSGSGVQTCSGGVQSQCDMRCHAGSHCVQQSNAQTCNLKCGGEECNQNCSGGEQGCLMQCIRNSWTQTCDAHTCEMTRSGSLNYYTGKICNSGNGPFCQRIMMNGSLGPFKTTCQRRKQCTCPKCLNRDCMTFTWRKDIFRCP